MSHTILYGSDQNCTCERSTPRSNPQVVVMRAARRAAHLTHSWIERSRRRQALSDLDEHQLADIGITQQAAEREAAKPFWV